MKRTTLTVLTYSTFMVLFLAATAVSQSPAKRAAVPVGEIITNSDAVLVNGKPTPRGSTVFNGSEIQTSDAAAFINLNSGGGVLSIAPGSKVKISRERAKVIAQVLKGSVTMRSSLASMVIAPDRVVNSEPNNLYTVTISDSGSVVESLLKSVAVQTADGAVQTVAAQAANALTAAVAPAKGASRPSPASPEAITSVRGPLVTAGCTVSGNTLWVSGEVFNNGVGVQNATVSLRLFFKNRARLGPLTTTTNGTNNYQFHVTNANVPVGGIALITVSSPIRAGDRCTF